MSRLRKIRLPGWADELALVLAWPITSVVVILLGDAVGPEAVVVILPAMVIAWGAACLGGLARSDPIGFLSLVGPPLAVATANATLVLVGGRPSHQLVFFVPGWIFVWTLAASRLWPWWSRTLMRRHRPNSPEVELRKAWLALSQRWQSWSTPEEGRAIWADLLALEQWETSRTRPVIDGLFAYWELVTAVGADVSRAEPLVRRVGEEWNRLWAAPRLRLPKRGPDPFERPTRATRLEYVFPRTEALLAVASPEQSRQIAAESARLAIRDAGIADPELEVALDEATHGRSTTEARHVVDERLEVLRDARDASPVAAADDSDDGSWGRLARRVIALSAVSEALTPDLSSVAAADVVYESIRSELDHRRSARYERLAADIVGPALATKAVVIAPAVPRTAVTTSARGGDVSRLGQQFPGRVVRLGAIGIVAGLAGSIAQSAWQQPTAPLGGNVADAVRGQILAYLIGYILLRPLGRPSFSDLVVLFIGSVASGQLVGPVTDLVSLSVSPFADPSRTDVALRQIFPVASGLIYGAILIAGSIALSPRREATPP